MNLKDLLKQEIKDIMEVNRTLLDDIDIQLLIKIRNHDGKNIFKRLVMLLHRNTKGVNEIFRFYLRDLTETLLPLLSKESLLLQLSTVVTNNVLGTQGIYRLNQPYQVEDLIYCYREIIEECEQKNTDGWPFSDM